MATCHLIVMSILVMLETSFLRLVSEHLVIIISFFIYAYHTLQYCNANAYHQCNGGKGI